MPVSHHSNIHLIIEQSVAFNDPNASEADLTLKANRVALLKSAAVEDLHLFKISGKSSQEELLRLKDNLSHRVATCVDVQESAFLKDFYSTVAHAYLMKSENKETIHINVACLKKEIAYFSYRDLNILNEIDFITNRRKNQAFSKFLRKKSTHWLSAIINIAKSLIHYMIKKVQNLMVSQSNTVDEPTNKEAIKDN